jgi:multiple sugar transport system ATP-binding protein
VQEAADTLGLNAFLDRKPKALSGGQRQRVALGRAIVRNPSVFLFDEPLSNLDAELRVHMRAELSKLQRKLKTTTVYVTHDQVEAMTMGHRIAVLRPCGSDPKVSNLTQVGTPMEIYDTPANLFTAGFMGTPKMNLLKARLSRRRPRRAVLRRAHPGVGAVQGGGAEVPRPRRRPGHPARAHRCRARGRLAERLRIVSGPVEILEPLGHEVIVHFDVQGETLAGRLRSHQAPARPGETITLVVRTEAMHLFDPVDRAAARLTHTMRRKPR